MRKEAEAAGKTVEAAIVNGAQALGVDRTRVEYEILEMPKKGFLGFGETPARVKVYYETGAEYTALDFINMVLKDIGIEAQTEICEMKEDSADSRNAKLIKITGESAGMLIGHHGETLDALQYLANLAANKTDAEDEKDNTREYVRISVDIENYRVKREETLRQLAQRMAEKVKKYKKSITLEPMNPYERRIVHSEVQKIEGVMTTSVGTDNNRKVVICLENKDRDRSNTRNQRAKPPRPKPLSDIAADPPSEF